MPTVMGLFRSSAELDKAVNRLLSQQFKGYQLRVVPMHRTLAAPKPKGLRAFLMRGGFFGDTIDRNDGTSLMDGVAAGATLFGLAGMMAGAALPYGPVALGTGGIMLGGLVGYLFDLLIPEMTRREYAQAIKKASTLVLVDCDTPRQADGAEQILRDTQAHEVGRIG